MPRRGQTTLFTNIFITDTPNTDRKGQRNVLIDRRDEALAYRYYFHIEILRKRYDDALKDLENEFFITENVIVQRLTPYADYLRSMKVKNTKPIVMRKKYPWFNWAA